MKRDRKTAAFANKHRGAAAAGFTEGRPGWGAEGNGRGNLYPAAPARALFCQRTQRRAFKPWPFLRLLPREGRRRLQPGGLSIPACPNLPGSSRGEMRRARLAGSLPGDSGHCNAHLPAVPVSYTGPRGGGLVSNSPCMGGPIALSGSGALGALGRVRSDRRSPAKPAGAQPFPLAHANEVKPAFTG